MRCGIHQFFLGELNAAEQSFNESMGAGIEAATAEGKPTGIVKEGSFFILLAAGYKALAQLSQGHISGTKDFENVLAAFEEMKGISIEAKEDAETGLSQLLRTRLNLNLK